MPSDFIERLMSEDFEAMRTRLEKDGFCERILRILEKKRRARIGVILAAGGLGAAFAGAQFTQITGVFASIAPVTSEFTSYAQTAGLSSSFAPQLLAALAISVALLSTALVLRAEK